MSGGAAWVHERPDAWLFLTAYRLASSFRRRWAVRSMAGTQAAPQSGDLFEGMVLSDLLSSLDPRQRAALLLRYHYGLSTRETADVLGCPEGTVKSLAARGRSAVRAALSTPEREVQ